MSKFIILFLLVVFLIYISLCSYKYIMHRKIKLVFLRFMTSCLLLITFTAIFYSDLFLNVNWMNKNYGDSSSKNDSKVFLNSYRKGIEDNNNQTEVNKGQTGNKVTAYFDNTSPARGAVTNLIVSGPPGGKVTAICQYKGHGTPYIMNIEDNGKAVIPVRVDSNAESGYSVVVDISVNYEGKLFKTNSVFTPK